MQEVKCKDMQYGAEIPTFPFYTIDVSNLVQNEWSWNKEKYLISCENTKLIYLYSIYAAFFKVTFHDVVIDSKAKWSSELRKLLPRRVSTKSLRITFESSSLL